MTKEELITEVDLFFELDSRYLVSTKVNGITHKTDMIGDKTLILASHFRYLASYLEKEHFNNLPNERD